MGYGPGALDDQKGLIKAIVAKFRQERRDRRSREPAVGASAWSFEMEKLQKVVKNATSRSMLNVCPHMPPYPLIVSCPLLYSPDMTSSRLTGDET